MAGSSAAPVSLYLHIPFCASKCSYCDFYSVRQEEAGAGVVEAVVTETLAQLDRLLAALGRPAAATAYVGGGTPSALEPSQLGRLLQAIGPHEPAEWTVEANPESLDDPFLSACSKAGVNRLSVGLQSMREERLRLLGRPGGRDDNLRSLERLARRWKGEVNLDLIAGIPGQEPAELLQDLKAAIASGCGHLSLYELTVEPGTPLETAIARGSVAPNPREADEELWLLGKAALEAAGFENYEVSNFARPGRRCRHNIGYWRLEPYAGAGPGAASTVPREAAEAFLGRALGRSPVARLAAPRDIGSFLRGEKARWGLEGEEVAPVSFLLETLMTGLRMADGIEAAAFERRFGAPLPVLVPGLWQRWTDRGFADPAPGSWRLKNTGRLLLDRLLAECADVLRERPPRDLSVTWP